MRFIVNPAGNRIVDATPEETHALRPCVCAALRRHGCPEREIDDIAQHVEIVTWQAIAEGRVAGHDLQEPRDALVMWMLCVAQNAFRNYRHKASTWREVMTDEPVEWPSRSPVARLEARDLLRRIEARPLVARFLLSAALGEPIDQRREHSRMKRGTYDLRLSETRKWLQKVVASGHWREPPQPIPATPWQRKKKQ